MLVIIIVLLLSYSVFPTFYFKFKTKLLRKESKTKRIYLTFDDGPSIYTNSLLDLLKKYNIKASFFCVASFMENNKDIVKRMINEGHLVSLHSYYHKSAYLMGIRKVNTDFKKSIDVINMFGINNNFYRPPWGVINLISLWNIKKYNLKLTLWNVMAEDWKGNITKEEIVSRLLKRVKAGDIICLHDGRGKNEAPLRTILALSEVIPVLLENGYEFETVEKYYEK